MTNSFRYSSSPSLQTCDVVSLFLTREEGEGGGKKRTRGNKQKNKPNTHCQSTRNKNNFDKEKKNMETIPRWKVVIVGDGGVGSTCMLRMIREGNFEEKYIPTLGVEVHPVVFSTTVGPVCLNCWDCAGQEKFGGLRDGYYIGANAAVIMFDVTSRVTYRKVPMWHRDVVRVCGNIPIVICGNKVDVRDRVVKPKATVFPIKHNLPYCETSVRSTYNIFKPFEIIIQKLTCHPDLKLTALPPLNPACPIDERLMAEYEAQFKKTQETGFGDDDFEEEELSQQQQQQPPAFSFTPTTTTTSLFPEQTTAAPLPPQPTFSFSPTTTTTTTTTAAPSAAAMTAPQLVGASCAVHGAFCPAAAELKALRAEFDKFKQETLSRIARLEATSTRHQP